MKKITLICALLPVFLISLCRAQPKNSQPPRFIVAGPNDYLLGASVNRQWLPVEKARTLVKGGETYLWFGSLKSIAAKGRAQSGQVKGSKAISIDEPCADTYEVKMQPNIGAIQSDYAVAVSGVSLAQKAKLFPRSIQKIQSPVYKKIVAQWLISHGLKNPKVEMPAVWRVDLDGDGTQEVLISALRHHQKSGIPSNIAPDSQAGDYCLLLMRRVVGKSVQTVALANEIYQHQKTFNAPNVTELEHVLDLDGDGKMEIVISSRYYEGGSFSVLEWNKGNLKEVLGTGCGV